MNGAGSSNGSLSSSSSMRSSVSNGFHSNHANNAVVRATEGWLELFLTPYEKFAFSRWEERMNDKSIVHKSTKHVFRYLAHHYIPDNVAPNVVTITGLLCLAQAWYITHNYGHAYPTSCTWLAVIGLLFFFITNSVEPYHTDRIKQRTALGEMFRYSCDSCSTIFMTLLITYCLWGEDVGGDSDNSNNTCSSSSLIQFQWYAVQSSQIVLFLKHLSAYRRNDGLRYKILMGPGEVILIAILLLAIRGILGIEKWTDIYQFCIQKFSSTKNPVGAAAAKIAESHYNTKITSIGEALMQMTYSVLYVSALLQTIALAYRAKKTNKDITGWSTFGITISLLMRLVPAILMSLDFDYDDSSSSSSSSNSNNTHGSITAIDVICDGFFMAVLTSDITLSKMAKREIHPWVVLMSFATTLSHTVILILCLVYYIAVFADLSFYMNMPLLATCRNIYCDGIYDLCHMGHKKAFQNALQYTGGNRLFVGVVGDKDANAYKRPPIMSHDERCAEVEACKAVTKVIQNAPCFGITQEFLDLHQIHIVAYGEEYLERYPDPKDDPYYGYVRSIGIAKALPRTKGLSTSDLIKRIQNASADSLGKKSPT